MKAFVAVVTKMQEGQNGVHIFVCELASFLTETVGFLSMKSAGFLQERRGGWGDEAIPIGDLTLRSR